ncbi:cytochrome c [Congregibacter brevis]|uniref:Cytochrome c n=1 Tax=Congregibacter brevis TaxID=3081201 RepID=A0ABZ0IBY7_9GAMM|nr:cytochrome c [Congregibacter sp. IMCC45268]
MRSTFPYRIASPIARGILLAALSMGCAPAYSENPRFGIGEAATPELIQAWNIDVRPDGLGLPVGHGTAAEGAALYEAHCESCHGVDGVGGAYGSLVGRLADDNFSFGVDPALKKTIGNYWPYATTIFDYLRRAMPFDAPGSLKTNEVYSLVAYLLAENRVISEDMVMNQSTLPKVRMPAAGRFVPDDRKGGHEVR